MSKTQQQPLFWRAVWAVIWKDIRIERHTGQSISVMVAFSIAAVVTFNLALQGDLAAVRNVASGLLWVTILLAGTLGMTRSFALEEENGNIDAILMSPVGHQVLFVGKLIGLTLFTFILELILLFVFFVFTNQPFLQLSVAAVLLLGTIGYVTTGVIVTSMIMRTRARSVLLPVLLLPLTLPTVLAAASATAVLITLNAPTWGDVGFQVALVIFYDVLVISTGSLVYRYVVET